MNMCVAVNINSINSTLRSVNHCGPSRFKLSCLKRARSYIGIPKKVLNSQNQEISIAQAPVRTSFTYTGREYEPELGMYYYRARYYDPSTGRFLQQDPDPGKLANPNTFLSKYVYTANNPVMYTDPSGKIFGIDDLAIILIIVAAGAIQGGLNVNAAKDAGYTDGNKLFQTFLNGFITGSLQAVAGIVGGPIGVFAGAFIGGTLNNAINQTIFKDPKGDGGINWNQALTSGAVMTAGAAVGYGMGYAFGESLGLATVKYTGTLYSGGQLAADLFGIFGSHIPGNSAPSGIAPCQGADICNRYQQPRYQH